MDLQKGWTDDETFSFWMPLKAVESVDKSANKSGADKSGKRWVQGIASTEDRDLQGEVVVQNGIDFAYFLKHGFFNNDHKPGFENKVGQPTECRVTKNGLWVKGFLFDKNKIADDIWGLINSLDASGATRKVGFSIQGKVKRREGNVIKECWIQDIAITPAPVNSATWAEVAKSLSAQKWDFAKSLDDAELRMAKAGVATAVAAPIATESLEGKVKRQKQDDDVEKSMSFDEAVDFIMKSEGMTLEGAKATARVLLTMIEE